MTAKLLAISTNTALFSLLGTMYGGDGRVNFALPDLRGRAPIGFGLGMQRPDYAQGQAVDPGPDGPNQSTEPGVLPPGYLALNWCIALEGSYPWRP